MEPYVLDAVIGVVNLPVSQHEHLSCNSYCRRKKMRHHSCLLSSLFSISFVHFLVFCFVFFCCLVALLLFFFFGIPSWGSCSRTVRNTSSKLVPPRLAFISLTLWYVSARGEGGEGEGEGDRGREMYVFTCSGESVVIVFLAFVEKPNIVGTKANYLHILKSFFISVPLSPSRSSFLSLFSVKIH